MTKSSYFKAYAAGACVIILAALGCGFAVWKLHTNTQASVAANPGWKVYEDKALGLSFEYPPTFTVEKDNHNGYFVVRVYDPDTKAAYLAIMEWEAVPDDAKDIFTGPYPKELPPTTVSSMTVEEKTLNGMKGVEEYGYIAEGHEYTDAFMYKNTHLWAVYYDPVLEGRIADYAEPGTPAPDKDIYERILASVRIAP